MIRVALPFHLRRLAGVEREVQLDVPAPVTMAAVLDVLESEYPMLRGTIREHATQQRRAYLRFFALKQDISLEPLAAPLPEAIAMGEEPLRIVGAMAGG